MSFKTEITLVGHEAQAHDFRDCVRFMERRDDNNWSTTELLIADAMVARWSAEMTRDEWVTLANALHNIKLTDDNGEYSKRAFRNLKRAGLIYSRRYRGKTVYGIQFNQLD